MADSSSRVQCSGIAWHPDVATQLVTSSVDDRSPIIQVCWWRRGVAYVVELYVGWRGVRKEERGEKWGVLLK